MKSDKSLYDALYKYTKPLSVALGYRDILTQRHSNRVRELSTAIGVQYGLTEQELNILKISATFHDIGKIGIPDRILMKSSKLDEKEWLEMKHHPEIGEKIILSTELKGSFQASFVIRHHHEHYDGQGYPDGLSGEDIPICARIISIADSYDAMAVTRSYHHARKHTEIMGILHSETGKKHDPGLMHVFCEIIESNRHKAET